MIDTLQRIAVRLRWLRHVALLLALACLAALLVIVFVLPAAGDANRYLIPALVGFVWGLSAYGFIDTFQSVPEKMDRSRGRVARAGRGLARAWFWFLALLLAVSTLAALLLTWRLISVA